MSEPLSPEAWIRRLGSTLGVPATEGNHIEVLRNGNEIFPAMLEAIDRASRTVDLVTFVYWRGRIARRFAAALAQAARRGCRVRVVLDAVGARNLDPEVIDTMTAAGCEVRWFRPIADGTPDLIDANHRTHRKILVCDSVVGFTGGVGIADEWDGDARDEEEWRDTHLRVHGPAVAGLQAGFIDNWTAGDHSHFDPATEQPWLGEPAGSSQSMVVRSSSQSDTDEMWRLMITLVTFARERLRIATAYFNPGEQLRSALCEAASRGVEIDVLVPGRHADKRFVQVAGELRYEELLEAGVGIHTYDTSMMHAKIVTVDRTLATVGSANFNQRSMRLDEEAQLVIVDRHVVSTLDDQFVEDLGSSTQIDPARWAERDRTQRLRERVVGRVTRWL